MIVDEVDDEGAIARSAWDAPEIDGNVYLNGETALERRRPPLASWSRPPTNMICGERGRVRPKPNLPELTEA